MFGYITVNADELKMREYRRYRSYYCGVCKSLKWQFGPVAQMTLTYDMSFLGLLLSALYEDETGPKKIRCGVHPFTKHEALWNEYTDYAAAVNVMLAYYKCKDDWTDEKKLHKKGAAAMLFQSFKKAAKHYPKQAKQIETYIQSQADAEAANETDLEAVAGITGELLGRLFSYREDEWQSQLYRMGYYLGEFIYILDAYDDLLKDQKKHNYNPLLTRAAEENFDTDVREILTLVAAESAKAFESMPILQDAEILRNILYSGMWTKFEKVVNERTGAKNS